MHCEIKKEIEREKEGVLGRSRLFVRIRQQDSEAGGKSE